MTRASETVDRFRAAQLLREDFLPLPSRDSGYRTVMLLGTTGAGKTTLVRQLLGTNPRTERFPSTSTARTTVAETELVVTDSPVYRAAVSFAPRIEVTEHLEENVVAAGIAILEGKSALDVLARLLDHVDQRFRFSYVLGAPHTLLPEAVDESDLDDDDWDDEREEPLNVTEIPDGAVLARTGEVLERDLHLLRDVIDQYVRASRAASAAAADTDADIEESLARDLEAVLRDCGVLPAIVDDILELIAARFDAFDVGTVEWAADDGHKWPAVWSRDSRDRAEFLRTLARFTSNHAKSFGRLLTPLVNGLRVAGPFRPEWATSTPRIVLLDGEGIGHVATSVAALSPTITSRLAEIDALLLVDNAMMPMQAAALTAMRTATVTGHADKLHFVFTHFDGVKGDALPTYSAREAHVVASVENVVHALAPEIGPLGERQLRARVDEARYFLGGLHRKIDPDKRAGQHTLVDLRRLLEEIGDPVEEVVTSAARLTDVAEDASVVERIEDVPEQVGGDRVLSGDALTRAVTEAAHVFHEHWRARLGIEAQPDVPKEHWARIKALTRRVKNGGQEYRHLQPVGELALEVQERIFRVLQEPGSWVEGAPEEQALDPFVREVSSRLTNRILDLTRRRLIAERDEAWGKAYDVSGTGSTKVRARIVEDEIYERAAPTSLLTTVGGESGLVRDVLRALSEVAEESGFRWQ